MPTFSVSVRLGHYTIEVDARDTDEAIELAIEELCENAGEIITGGSFSVAQVDGEDE